MLHAYVQKHVGHMGIQSPSSLTAPDPENIGSDAVRSTNHQVVGINIHLRTGIAWC